MAYTWGYIKENTLSKLNLEEEEANQQSFLSRFPYYANEAMTQICSSIKPREKFFIISVYDKQNKWDELRAKYDIYKGYPVFTEIIPNREDVDYESQLSFWSEWKTLYFINEPIAFPQDFIAFSDDVPLIKEPPLYIQNIQVTKSEYVEAYDDSIDYYGYNEIICLKEGTYKIPYKARWFFFTKDLDNDVVITAPDDICEAIPSYIASQCYKVDDETRAAIYRNEFEMFLARIDDTTFKSQRSLRIDGGW